ncbi:MAG TPA: hypothetical protein VMJ10_13390 [Kofleriaceae bacterium]|nr:hypothetical protein [Kofleriaceae bacterium]
MIRSLGIVLALFVPVAALAQPEAPSCCPGCPLCPHCPHCPHVHH